MTRIVFPLVAALMLAGCDKDAATPSGDDNRSAEGEVAGGTISDAMIPLDTVTSTPPAMKETAAAKPAGSSGPAPESDAADEAETPAAGETTAPDASAPAATPEAE